jgi:steroid delta-isomerase-like uncharacterized protein
MPAAENKQLVQQMTEAFNSGDVTIVDNLIDEALVDQTPFPQTAPDREGLKRQIQALRTAFPDVQFGIEDIVAEGETVAFRWTMEGTHEGPLLGQAPTHRRVQHQGNDFVTFSNGKIIQHRSADNLGELFNKLGMQWPPQGVAMGPPQGPPQGPPPSGPPNTPKT